MAVTYELVGHPLYERAMSLHTSDVDQRYLREPKNYWRTKFLQSYFHVRRPRSDGQSIVGLCDEWIIREDWEVAYIAEIAISLQWTEHQPLPDAEASAIGFTPVIYSCRQYLAADFVQKYKRHSETALRGGGTRGSAGGRGSNAPTSVLLLYIMKNWQ